MDLDFCQSFGRRAAGFWVGFELICCAMIWRR